MSSSDPANNESAVSDVEIVVNNKRNSNSAKQILKNAIVGGRRKQAKPKKNGERENSISILFQFDTPEHV